MEIEFLVQTLSSLVAAASPVVLASIGETVSEKSGVINLSLDGSIALSAMTGFAVALTTGSVWLAMVAAMAVGALMALVVAFASITLRLEQVAVGFVLAMLGLELADFLGNPFVRRPGPSVPHWPIPYLAEVPILGPIFFDQNLVVYLSFLAVVVSWWWIYKTQPGLKLQGVGERPESAFARGVNVNRLRYVYTVVGGALVGLAGASYSLSIKLGWSHRHTFGIGWIALAIVIFGGWNPWRVAAGSYLFGLLKALGSILQRNPAFANVPTQIFSSAPFALMIFALLLVSSEGVDRLLALLPPRVARRIDRTIRGRLPGWLGRPFVQE
ncbi:MAG TPA: ABC transporter permease [Anaerolineales bacterium]|nr:ABC transporter permease [Anaerolineales bacterium]